MAGQISSFMGLTANRNFCSTFKKPVRSFWQNVFRDPSEFLNWQARVLMQQSCALEVSGYRLFSNALPARNLTRFIFASASFYTASSVERLDFPGSLRPHTTAKQQISGLCRWGPTFETGPLTVQSLSRWTNRENMREMLLFSTLVPFIKIRNSNPCQFQFIFCI